MYVYIEYCEKVFNNCEKMQLDGRMCGGYRDGHVRLVLRSVRGRKTQHTYSTQTQNQHKPQYYTTERWGGHYWGKMVLGGARNKSEFSPNSGSQARNTSKKAPVSSGTFTSEKKNKSKLTKTISPGDSELNILQTSQQDSVVPSSILK